jgi:hypothetical protein
MESVSGVGITITFGLPGKSGTGATEYPSGDLSLLAGHCGSWQIVRAGWQPKKVGIGELG